MPIETPEQAQFIVDLRQRILQNMSLGKPEYEGIERTELERFIQILRSNRKLDADRGRRTGGSKSKAPAMSEEELKSLFS